MREHRPSMSWTLAGGASAASSKGREAVAGGEAVPGARRCSAAVGEARGGQEPAEGPGWTGTAWTKLMGRQGKRNSRQRSPGSSTSRELAAW